MARLYRPLLEPLGLTYPQYLVMLSLWDSDSQTVGSLSAKVGLESNTLTPLLKRMEGAGLLVRARSTTDERVTVISLTKAGKAMQDGAAPIRQCIVEATGMTAAQVEDLRDEVLALEKRITRSVKSE